MRKKYFGKGKEEKELLDRLREISKQDKTPEEVQAAIDSLLESDGISEWEESSSVSSSSLSSDLFFQSEDDISEKNEVKAVEPAEEDIQSTEKLDHLDEHGNQVLFYESEQKEDSDVNEDVVLSEEESKRSGSSESFELSFESDELELAYESNDNKILFDEKDDEEIETKEEEVDFVALESEIEIAESMKENSTGKSLSFDDESSDMKQLESSSDSKEISSFESDQLILEKNESEQVVPENSESSESSSSEAESSESIQETIDEELEPIALYGSETKEESYDDLANFLFNDGDTESSSESTVEELEFVTSMSTESEQSEESFSVDMVHPPKESHSITQKNRGGNKMADFNYGPEEKEVESKDGIHTDFDVCEAVKSVEKTVRLKDQIRILKTRITIEDVCPDSNVAVAVLLIDEHGKTVGIRGGEFHVPNGGGGDAYNDCDDNCTNLKVKFTFIVPEKNICDKRKLSIKVITHYTELPKH
jgi:hypothetical protein